MLRHLVTAWHSVALSGTKRRYRAGVRRPRCWVSPLPGGAATTKRGLEATDGHHHTRRSPDLR
jgi:hypothetical protein